MTCGSCFLKNDCIIPILVWCGLFPSASQLQRFQPKNSYYILFLPPITSAGSNLTSDIKSDDLDYLWYHGYFISQCLCSKSSNSNNLSIHRPAPAGNNNGSCPFQASIWIRNISPILTSLTRNGSRRRTRATSPSDRSWLSDWGRGPASAREAIQ